MYTYKYCRCKQVRVLVRRRNSDIMPSTSSTTASPVPATVPSSSVKPMASKKLAKKCLKLVKEAKKLGKDNLLRGIKNVRRGVKKNVKGIVLLGGDVKPIDLMRRIAVLCREAGVPYIYMPKKEDIKAVSGATKKCSTVLVKPRAEYKEFYDGLTKKLNNLCAQ